MNKENHTIPHPGIDVAEEDALFADLQACLLYTSDAADE